MGVRATRPNSLRSHRLWQEGQFKLVATKGRRASLGSLSIKWIPSPDGVTRFAFILRKKNGSAVFRNRVRRVLRPLFFKASETMSAKVWATILYLDHEQRLGDSTLHQDALQLFRHLKWMDP